MPHTETVLICYRGACTRAADPRGYNRITHGLYCIDCARRIERDTAGFETTPGGPMFPLLKLELPPGGAWEAGIVIARLPTMADDVAGQIAERAKGVL